MDEATRTGYGVLAHHLNVVVRHAVPVSSGVFILFCQPVGFHYGWPQGHGQVHGFPIMKAVFIYDI